MNPLTRSRPTSPNRPPRLEGQPPSTRQSRPRPPPPHGARSPSIGWRVGRGRWRRAPPDLPCAWRARPALPQVALRGGDAQIRFSDRESRRSRAGSRSTPPRARGIAPRRGTPHPTSPRIISHGVLLSMRRGSPLSKRYYGARVTDRCFSSKAVLLNYFDSPAASRAPAFVEYSRNLAILPPLTATTQ